jgi:hypothetical protein
MAQFTTIDNRTIPYEPKKLGLRGMRNLLECIEGIKEAEKKSQIFDLIERGMKICIDDFDPETCDIQMETAMAVMTETMVANTVKADERKKSE